MRERGVQDGGQCFLRRELASEPKKRIAQKQRNEIMKSLLGLLGAELGHGPSRGDLVPGLFRRPGAGTGRPRPWLI